MTAAQATPHGHTPGQHQHAQPLQHPGARFLWGLADPGHIHSKLKPLQKLHTPGYIHTRGAWADDFTQLLLGGCRRQYQGHWVSTLQGVRGTLEGAWHIQVWLSLCGAGWGAVGAAEELRGGCSCWWVAVLYGPGQGLLLCCAVLCCAVLRCRALI
jgi:hypothetical protein